MESKKQKRVYKKAMKRGEELQFKWTKEKTVVTKTGRVNKVKEEVPAPVEKIDPWSEGEFEEWMESHGLVRSEDVHKFRGNARNRFCDVITFDNKTIGPCWLTDGFFVRVDDLERVDVSEVDFIKFYDDRPVDRDGDTEDEEETAAELDRRNRADTSDEGDDW